MSSDPTIAENLMLAKVILTRGQEPGGPLTSPIYGDIHEAYKLLESFVPIIEHLYAPWDHNAECRFCDEQGVHAVDCPWIATWIQIIRETQRFTPTPDTKCDA